MQSISPLVVISLFLPRAYLAFTEALTLQPQVFFPMDNFLLLRISMINESLEEIKPLNPKWFESLDSESVLIKGPYSNKLLTDNPLN